MREFDIWVPPEKCAETSGALFSMKSARGHSLLIQKHPPIEKTSQTGECGFPACAKQNGGSIVMLKRRVHIEAGEEIIVLES